MTPARCILLLAVLSIALSAKDEATRHGYLKKLLQTRPLMGRATSTSVSLSLLTHIHIPVLFKARICEEQLPLEKDQSSGCTVGWKWLHLKAAGTRNEVVIIHASLDATSSGSFLSSDGYSFKTSPTPSHHFFDMVIQGLRPNQSYLWELDVDPVDHSSVKSERYDGRFVTQRTAGRSFLFDIFADSHFPSEQFSGDIDSWGFSVQFVAEEATLQEQEFMDIANNMNNDRPDFVVQLGDPFDLHTLGFMPALSRTQAALAHLYARCLISRLNQCGAMFQVLGNWEGESGCHPELKRSNAIWARKLYQINPRRETYEVNGKGSADENYYAFEWGDMLGVVLDVKRYTPTCHMFGNTMDGKKVGRPDTFSLGRDQMTFLEQVLKSSHHAYKFVFIHHPVGGKAGDEDNSIYGRGGGNAAYVGEQRQVHELMLKEGVQVLFHGHDHVFTDIVVDGIHYALTGTTCAPWRFERETTGYTKYWTTSGHTRVRVGTALARVEFVARNGTVLHSFDVKPNHSRLSHRPRPVHAAHQLPGLRRR